MTESKLVDRATLLEQGASLLSAAGIPRPRREARRLLPEEVADLATSVGEQVACGYLAGVRRRAAGEPLEYVTGSTGFRHLTVECDRRALIPRPETEGLVEVALARVSTGTAADICTGTGVVALSLAQEGRFSTVIGTDLSADALALARSNGERLGIRMTWLEGDLVAPLQGQTIDLIVANPPYIAAAEMRQLDRSVGDWEPELALLSGDDGLEHTRRLLVEAPAVLSADGWLAMEIDSRRALATRDLAQSNGWQEITILDDLFGRARYLVARREGRP